MKYFLLNYTKKRQYLLLIGDMIVLFISIFFSYFLRVYFNVKYFELSMVFSKLSFWLFLVILVHLFSLYLFDQYNITRLVNKMRASILVILSVLLSGLFISGIFFFLPKYVFGRQVLLIHIVVTSILMVLWRLFFTETIIRKSKPKRLAILGNGQIVSSFIEELARIPNSGFNSTSICLSSKSTNTRCFIPERLFSYKDVKDLLASNDFDVLAFDSTNSSFSNNEIRQILQLKHKGKAVFDLSNLYKNLTGKVPLTYIDGRWLLNSNGFQGKENLSYIRSKRIYDFTFSSLLLTVSIPLFLIISLAIKINSKGSVFFVQERLGVNREPFKCIKFRTMIENAEQETGPAWSSNNDPRITRVGRFLRKTRLDELPQLWNILKGDMSFVGPRPIRDHFANKLSRSIPFYDLRFSIKPGLSGWAQVNHDYAGSEEGQIEKFQYELFYIQHMSLFLDLLTIFKTMRKVLKSEGV